MALPHLIEIQPLTGPVAARVTVPGSKSITNRALILAALADGETTLEGALWSEDTQVMVDCLRELGFMINLEPDPLEPGNRVITVYGQGGRVPPGGTAAQPLELFVGNAGTAARFLTALVCLGEGVYRLHGVPRMHQRPQSALIQALRSLGYRIEAADDRLPAMVQGGGPRPGTCEVSIKESSQFASALLLAARPGGWKIRVTGENAEESPYVAMTTQLVAQFSGRPVGSRPGRVVIEPDASSGSYFWGASWLLHPGGADSPTAQRSHPGELPEDVTVARWPSSHWQIDSAFPKFLPLPVEVSRLTDLGDSIMTAIVLAPWAAHPVRFTQLGRLRVQECERVQALRTELTKCGAWVKEVEDTLEIRPSALHGALIETYEDHRMAMCFSILGLKIPGIRINNPACVRKTFPNFFQKLAAAPPAGLGAGILDPATGRTLTGAELFAGETEPA